MISKLLFSIRRTRQGLLCLTTLIGLAGLTAVPSARAVVSLEPASVVTGDSFSVEVIGYNTSNPGANIYLINQYLMPTFGTIAAYGNSALNGQTLVVNSNEYVSGGTTTDYVSLSVPSNFVPAGTKDNAGNTLNAIQFSLGIGFGGTNPLDVNPAILTYTATGSVTFNSFGVNTSNGVPLNSTLSNGNHSFSTFGTVFATPLTADISNNQVTSFSFTLTYASVPEPSTYAAVALGLGGLLLVVRRRRACA